MLFDCEFMHHNLHILFLSRTCCQCNIPHPTCNWISRTNANTPVSSTLLRKGKKHVSDVKRQEAKDYDYIQFFHIRAILTQKAHILNFPYLLKHTYNKLSYFFLKKLHFTGSS